MAKGNSLALLGIGTGAGGLGVLAILLVYLIAIGETGFAAIITLFIGIFVAGGAISLVLRFMK